MSFLLNLAIKYWRPVVSFLAMAVFLGWITYQSHRIDTLTQKLRASEATVASYEASFATLQSDINAKIKALEEETKREITRTKNQERLLGRIKGASDDQDAPAAPVLRGTIDRLYGRTTNTD